MRWYALIVPIKKDVSMPALNSELATALGAAAGQNFPSVGSGHALAKTVLSLADNVGWGFKMFFHKNTSTFT